MNAKQKTSMLLLMDLLIEAIEASGDRGIPEGHIYAAVMSKVELSVFQGVIDSFVEQGNVTRTNHLLKLTEKGKKHAENLHVIAKELMKALGKGDLT